MIGVGGRPSPPVEDIVVPPMTLQSVTIPPSSAEMDAEELLSLITAGADDGRRESN